MRVEDLKVYRKLFKLTQEIYQLTITFPKHEMYELGSQLRRSSNSAPANLAEGFGNPHTNIYTECINRAQGEIRETKHHLRIAFMRKYLIRKKLDYLIDENEECSKMLFGLSKSLKAKKRK